MINVVNLLRDIRRKLQDGTLTVLDIVRAINGISQLILDLADGVPVPMGADSVEAEQCQIDLRDEVCRLAVDMDGQGSEPEIAMSGPFIDLLLPIALKQLARLLEKWLAQA